MKISDIKISISYPLSEVDQFRSYISKGCANFQLTEDEVKQLIITGRVHKQVGSHLHEIEFSADEDITDCNDPEYKLRRDISIEYATPVTNMRYADSNNKTFKEWQTECVEIVNGKARDYFRNIIMHILINGEDIDGISVNSCYIDNTLRKDFHGYSLEKFLKCLSFIDFTVCVSVSLLRKDGMLDTFTLSIRHGMGITTADMKYMCDTGDIYSLISSLLGHEDDEEEDKNE